MQTLDPDAHLKDPDLYRQYYQGDSYPGQFIMMMHDEPRLLWAWEHVRPTADVIDIGCHKGEMTIYLRQRTRGRVVGVDIAEGAIKDARKMWEPLKIEWINSTAEAIPLPDDRFDVAVLCEILEHVIDPEPVIREAERLVRDGGAIITSTPIDAIEMGKGELDEREAITGLRLNAHVREFLPEKVFADRENLRLGTGSIHGISWRLAAYTVRK